MRRGSVFCAALFLLACLAPCFVEDAQAHRVNVFAFVDGDAVRVESSFSRSQKVKNGKLAVSDSVTGGFILEGVTDGEGVFRFRPPAEFLRTGHGLTIRLDAGEGHQDTWDISPEELAALSTTPSGATAPSASPAIPAAPVPVPAPAVSAPSPSASSEAELEALVGRVVEAKLLPVKQALARQEDSGPGLRDIIGGIGWILGLLGLGTYLKYRR